MAKPPQNTQQKTSDALLAHAVQDQKTTDDNGALIEDPIEGVKFRKTPMHIDDRGRLFEVFREDWGVHAGDFKIVYASTIRAGFAKGWALHKTYQDRYIVAAGEVMVVLYDARPGSSTFGKVFKKILSAHEPTMMNIPECVWHADFNVTDTEAMILNLPTKAYDRNDPDKFRLPLNTDLIPFKADGFQGY